MGERTNSVWSLRTYMLIVVAIQAVVIVLIAMVLFSGACA